MYEQKYLEAAGAQEGLEPDESIGEEFEAELGDAAGTKGSAACSWAEVGG